MANPAGGRNYAPMVRGYVSDILKNNREKVYDKIKQAILDDPIRALNEIRWCLPKEINIDIDHQVTMDTTAITPEMLSHVFELRQQLDEQRAAEELVEVRGEHTVVPTEGTADNSLSLAG